MEGHDITQKISPFHWFTASILTLHYQTLLLDHSSFIFWPTGCVTHWLYNTAHSSTSSLRLVESSANYDYFCTISSVQSFDTKLKILPQSKLRDRIVSASQLLQC